VNTIATILKKHERDLAGDWSREMTVAIRREDLMNDRQLQQQVAGFIRLLQSAVASDAGDSDVWQPAFAEVREFLADFSRSRALQGFSPTETALFVLSLKKPVVAALRNELGSDPNGLAEHTWHISDLLDKMALFTTEAHQKAREEVIARQQQEMLELSTPVVKLWEGILALPLIGTLDSARTSVVMETLLQSIVDTGSGVAIIDITGVPTVDTLVAQHLIKTVTAARLMGADCIISGIRPQIAQTIVHLGVALGDVITKSSLADAFELALRRRGLAVSKAQRSEKEKKPRAEE
jgi:rsbT co-antagonist protein RsbR